MTEKSRLIPADLLAIMHCPKCSGTLVERPDPAALVCTKCGTAYAVRDGIPNMIVDDADGPA